LPAKGANSSSASALLTSPEMPTRTVVILLAACGSPHLAAKGEPCQYDSDCAQPAGGTGYCPCGKCEEEFPVRGSTCNGQACTVDETCVGSISGPNGCVPSAAQGQSCATVNCLSGLFCNSSNLCVVPGAVGQPCDPTREDSCAAPGFCDGATATCAAPRPAGGACDPMRFERVECASGTACSLVSRTCVERQLNGASCTDDAGCLSNFCAPDDLCKTNVC
jgi:hypothetical protein